MRQQFAGERFKYMQPKDIPIMSVNESIETDRGQRHIAQLYAVS